MRIRVDEYGNVENSNGWHPEPGVIRGVPCDDGSAEVITDLPAGVYELVRVEGGDDEST